MPSSWWGLVAAFTLDSDVPDSMAWDGPKPSPWFLKGLVLRGLFRFQPLCVHAGLLTCWSWEASHTTSHCSWPPLHAWLAPSVFALGNKQTPLMVSCRAISSSSFEVLAPAALVSVGNQFCLQWIYQDIFANKYSTSSKRNPGESSIFHFVVCEPLQLVGGLLEGRGCVGTMFVSLVMFSQNQTLGWGFVAHDLLGTCSQEKRTAKGWGRRIGKVAFPFIFLIWPLKHAQEKDLHPFSRWENWGSENSLNFIHRGVTEVGLGLVKGGW